MAAAAVPSLLLLALFEGSRGWPGLISEEPGRGLYGLSGYLFTGPDWLLHAAVFAAITVIFVLLLGTAAVFDRDGLAADSLRWAGRPRGIRRLMLTALLCLTVMCVLPHDAAEMLGIIAALLACLLLAAAPFLSGHPATLVKPALLGWWRPWWPGGRVLWLIVPLWVLPGPAAEWALNRMDVSNAPGGELSAVLAALWMSAVAVLSMLAAAALWFGHRGWHSFAGAMRALLRWRVLRAVIALELYLLCLIVATALPFMVVVGYRTLALPQFASLSADSLSRAQKMLLAVQHPPDGVSNTVIYLLIIAAILPMSFARQRLQFMHGLGGRLGPDSPYSGASRAECQKS